VTSKELGELRTDAGLVGGQLRARRHRIGQQVDVASHEQIIVELRAHIAREIARR
jgi:hypothetical protein